jgi:hypothetical protein
MRELADADRIRLFMRALGEASAESARVYFTGGATAVLFGWRSSTIDVDVKIRARARIDPAGGGDRRAIIQRSTLACQRAVHSLRLRSVRST